ncbi:single-stranded DNA-binding protein [Ligilactobacillus acidipiscis]|uniref:single-stranded DNA-binding protein n=1 Tax=Ligilactobacillus acidipiscis TaxID=89059 RepID=UPI0023F8E6AA|nr:single-stranded DNA-binding protein [Ligilactobacillus acidipiscis]WEV56153.1 single-stranded DNA-binding protein [Ligilactobacillus acidipiscis]
MNEFNGIGRLTKDLDLRYTKSGKAVASFTLAINGFNDHTDFIRCQAWNKTAENLANYTHKGSQVSITGRINTGNYQSKDGKTVYTTDVVVNQFDLLDPKQERQDKPGPYNQQNIKQGQQIDISDADLPF